MTWDGTYSIQANKPDLTLASLKEMMDRLEIEFGPLTVNPTELVISDCAMPAFLKALKRYNRMKQRETWFRELAYRHRFTHTEKHTIDGYHRHCETCRYLIKQAKTAKRYHIHGE